ncbi:MAG: hypothetical protein ACPG4X_05450, partial [Pikeienuella sp.]
ATRPSPSATTPDMPPKAANGGRMAIAPRNANAPEDGSVIGRSFTALAAPKGLAGAPATAAALPAAKAATNNA